MARLIGKDLIDNLEVIETQNVTCLGVKAWTSKFDWHYSRNELEENKFETTSTGVNFFVD